MSKDVRVYLAQILERVQRIETFTQTGEQAFLDDLMMQDAVIRNFEVIGEAAKRVPDAYRIEHPDVPWSDLAAFRDVLIHQYEGVSLELIWSTIADHLPALKTALENLLPRMSDLEQDIGDGPGDT